MAEEFIYTEVKKTPRLTCDICKKEFQDEVEQKFHYKSKWHRYNIKRKVAGVAVLSEDVFLARQSALAERRKMLDENPMLSYCSLCCKAYRSSKAYAQHLTSEPHLLRASEENYKPEPAEETREEESILEEIDPKEYYEEIDINPFCCFMCDLEHHSIENCMVHMRKKHDFFIPDFEYLKDPKGFLTYLGLKVKRDFNCLYCNERRHPFSSLEGVRKHMSAKSHCKVRLGDGGDDEEGELEDFYDYTTSYIDSEGRELILADLQNNIEFGIGGFELIITKKGDNGEVYTKILGSRNFLQYYRQKPRPKPANDLVISKYRRSMGLTTVIVPTKQHMLRMEVLKSMNRSGVEAMRTRIGMKNKAIRNLPKNVLY